MDDPGWSWPAWKFGMKRDALFTTLHDQYNTFQSTIQDPDAFHHDVYEISISATTTAEFHRLLAGRRDQRLRELNDSLESASFEIIANPNLIGTPQWEHAVQLFRTRSLDSLVRFFASYLPADHPWHVRDDDDDVVKQEDKSAIVQPIFDDALTTEPTSMPHSISHTSLHQLPPSPRSLTVCSDDSSSDAHAQKVYYLDTLTPTRSLSLDSERGQSLDLLDDHFREDDHYITTAANTPEPKIDDCPTQCHDDESSQSSGPDTPSTLSDMGDELEVTEVRKVDASTSPVDIVDLTTCEDTTETISPGEARHHTPSPISTPKATATKNTPKTTAKASPRVVPTRLSSGLAVDTAVAKPFPLSTSMRLRTRSASPSRPWPLVHAAVRHPGDDRGRACRLSTRLAHLDTISSQQSYDQRSRRANSRRRQHSGGVEKPVPRTMRTRLRERREAVGTYSTRGR